LLNVLAFVQLANKNGDKRKQKSAVTCYNGTTNIICMELLGVPISAGTHMGSIMGMQGYSLDINDKALNLHFGETHRQREVHK
jgi:hypothetical protein